MLSFRIKKLGKSDADSLFFFGLCSLCPIIYLTFPKIQWMIVVIDSKLGDDDTQDMI